MVDKDHHQHSLRKHCQKEDFKQWMAQYRMNKEEEDHLKAVEHSLIKENTRFMTGQHHEITRVEDT